MDAHYIGNRPGLAAPELAHQPVVDLAPLGAVAASPAGLTIQKESAPVAQATQSREQNEHANFATDAVAEKAFLTLRALLALQGHVLSRTHGDDGPLRFYVTRWGLVREFPDFPSVHAFADQVGATRA